MGRYFLKADVESLNMPDLTAPLILGILPLASVPNAYDFADFLLSGYFVTLSIFAVFAVQLYFYIRQWSIFNEAHQTTQSGQCLSFAGVQVSTVQRHPPNWDL
jgi:hypothetical protein